GFTSPESGVRIEADGPAVSLAGLPEAEAGAVSPAASPATVTIMTDAAASFFRRIHPVALINFLPPGTSCRPARRFRAGLPSRRKRDAQRNEQLGTTWQIRSVGTISCMTNMWRVAATWQNYAGEAVCGKRALASRGEGAAACLTRSALPA